MKEEHTNRVDTLCISDDGERLYSGSGDDTIKVWDTATNRLISSTKTHSTAVLALTYCSKHQEVFTGALNGGIKIWEAGSVRLIHTQAQAHPNLASQLVLSEDANTLYSVSGHAFFSSSDKVIKVWRVAHTASG
jgi:WD40 repeat protein